MLALFQPKAYCRKGKSETGTSSCRWGSTENGELGIAEYTRGIHAMEGYGSRCHSYF